MTLIHFILMTLKLRCVFYFVFDIPDAKKIGRLTCVFLFLLMAFEILRFREVFVFDFGALESYSTGLAVTLSTMFFLEKKRYIAVAIGAYLFLSLLDMTIAGLISTIFFDYLTSIFYQEWVAIAASLLGLLFVAISSFLLKKYCIRFELDNFNWFGVMAFVIWNISYGFYISGYMLLAEFLNDIPAGWFLGVLSLTGGFFAIVLVFVALHRGYRLVVNQLAQQHLEEMLEQKKQFVEVEAKQVDAIRMFGHDWNEHLIALAILASQNDANAVSGYIRDLMKAADDFSLLTENVTGSATISANLYYLQEKYNDVEIEFEWNGMLPDDTGLSKVEMTKLCMNLLKNAYEATSKVNDKYVIVNVTKDEKSYFISIKNSFNGEYVKDGTDYLTTKSNKEEHGYGTKILQNIIKKHNGEIKYFRGQSEFEVLIELPKVTE